MSFVLLIGVLIFVGGGLKAAQAMVCRAKVSGVGSSVVQKV